MNIIFNADDFGYSKSINYGILESYLNGVVRSTTLMVNAKHVDHAVSLAKENPGLGVGVHLVLTYDKPIRSDVPSLVNNHGYFKGKNNIFSFKDIEIKDVEKEWESQIEKFINLGLTPTHLDSHHFVHSQPYISYLILKLGEKYNLPVRNNFGIAINTCENIKLTEVFYSSFFDNGVSLETLYKLSNFTKYNSIEVMCHPGYIDKLIYNESSYNLKRMEELYILTSDDLKKWINKNNIELINYKQL